MIRWAIPFVLLFTSGCGGDSALRSDQARITIRSNPPGATIISKVSSEREPQSYLFTVAPGQTAGITEFITARWVSGATTSKRINFVGGQTVNYVIHRSTNDPGLDKDIQWAMHLEQSRLQQDANDAQQSANYNALLLGILDGMNKASAVSSSPTSRSMTCRPPLFRGGTIQCTSD